MTTIFGAVLAAVLLIGLVGREALVLGGRPAPRWVRPAIDTGLVLTGLAFVAVLAVHLGTLAS